VSVVIERIRGHVEPSIRLQVSATRDDHIRVRVTQLAGHDHQRATCSKHDRRGSETKAAERHERRAQFVNSRADARLLTRAQASDRALVPP
jgi:hypothetical protein